MNTKKITFKWQYPAATYIVCRTADIPAFRALAYVQEAAGAQCFCKIGRPEIDLPSLMALADLGATFYGNIERTMESGPAVIAGYGRELVIVPCNDHLQPVITVLENGTMPDSCAAQDYWRVFAGARSVLKSTGMAVPLVERRRLTRNVSN